MLFNFRTENINVIQKTAYVLVSLGYAFFLCSLPMEGIFDRDNYLTMASESPIIITGFLAKGIKSFLFNEPIWFAINSILGFFLDDVNVVRFLIFFSSFTVSYLLLCNNPKNIFWIVLILFFPNVVKNFIIHLRQGVAIAFFLIGWFSLGKFKRYFFIFASPFIHASFFIIIFFITLSWFLNKLKLAPDVKSGIFVSSSFALALSAVQLSGAIGARQSESTISDPGAISGAGFMFWSFVLFFISLQGRLFFHTHAISFGILVFYLSAYFFTPISGRVFESGILLVLLTLLHTNGLRRIILIGGMLVFNVSLMLVKYTKPLMGFGVG